VYEQEVKMKKEGLNLAVLNEAGKVLERAVVGLFRICRKAAAG
jgi:hypothetical protein